MRISTQLAALETILSVLLGRSVSISDRDHGVRSFVLPVVDRPALQLDYRTARRAVPLLAARWQRKIEARHQSNDDHQKD